MNYYNQFIKPREITKDINFFYNEIIEVVCNDIFSKYVYDNRKSIQKTYELNNFLSIYDKTRLQFKNDKISIEFFVNDISGEIPQLVTFKNVGTFENYKLNNVDMIIKINLTSVEHTNKLIYDNNPFFLNLRKQISEIYQKFIEELNKREESKFKYINRKLLNLKKCHYDTWNKFIQYLINATNPEFNNLLDRFKVVLNGILSDKISTKFELMHNTDFYLNNCHLRQIKKTKFLSNLKKVCLDDDEIIYLTNEVANCFNHKIKNYNDSIEFIDDIIEHFNFIYHIKEKTIDFLVSENWKN